MTTSTDNRPALLSSTYFGPVQWYQKLNRRKCVVERHDNFVKQTYRNRCIIATANGTQALTVPVERSGDAKCPMCDVRVSDHGNWRHLHWNALVSAYGDTPFFEYYADDVRPFFERRWRFLLDMNTDIMHTMCQLLDIRPDVAFTDGFADAYAMGCDDMRDAIRPKHPLPDPSFEPRPYYQVRAAKFGFMPNLSILDLLFNEGPEAVLFL